MNQTRTSWDHFLILAIPFSRWGAEPYIVDPILFPSGILSKVVSGLSDHRGDTPNRIHPYQQACLWRQEMERDPRLTKANIAAREGLSRARVTQIMNLLQLPEEIQKGLKNPPILQKIPSLSERCLRRTLAWRDQEAQLRMWRELVHKRTILVRK